MKQSAGHATIRRTPGIADMSWPAPVTSGRPRDVLAELQQASELISSTVNELRQRREASQNLRARILVEQSASERHPEPKVQLPLNDFPKAPVGAVGFQKMRLAGKRGPIEEIGREEEMRCAVGEVAASLSAMLAEADKKSGRVTKATTFYPAAEAKTTPANMPWLRPPEAKAGNTNDIRTATPSRPVEADAMRLQISRLTEEIAKLRQERNASLSPAGSKEVIPEKKVARQLKRARLPRDAVVGPVIISLNHGVEGVEHKNLGSRKTETGLVLQSEDIVWKKNQLKGAGPQSKSVDSIPPAKLETSPVRRSHSSVLLRLAAILILIGAGEGIRRIVSDQPGRQLPVALAQKTIASDNEQSKPDINLLRDVTATGSLPNAPISQSGGFSLDKREEDELRQAFSKQETPSESRSFEAALAAGNPRALFDKAIYLTEAGDRAALAEAALLYGRAAEKGFTPAQFRLGVAYEKGLGVPMDKGKAAVLYERAARGGNIKAMHNLAAMKASTLAGGQPDYTLAAQWFKAAAERGLSDSQYNYALLAARGLGMSQNLSEALKYLSLAAGQGDADAALRRDQLIQMLSKDEIEAVERDINAFNAKVETADANEKTLPPPPWLERDWFTQMWFRKSGQGA